MEILVYSLAYTGLVISVGAMVINIALGITFRKQGEDEG